MGSIRDDPALIEQAFDQAARAADVVITSGGVSVGEADFVKQILERLGEVLFWKIAMKPGRPLAYGKIGGAHFFGLPGNPVSAMVTFYQFVREALLVLMGVSESCTAADAQGRLHHADQESAGPHRISARHPEPRCGWTMDRARDRQSRLRHSVVHEPGQLLHRPAR